MPRPAIDFHPEAVAEARAARAWYEARSPAAAEAFVVEVDRAIERILDDPDRPPVYMLGTRAVLLRRFPYLVVFRRTETGVQVIAIAHGRRRPGYWRSRARQ